MKPNNKEALGKIPLKIAIVGGGRACRFFLQRLQASALPFLDVEVLGVCDIDPTAEGLILAREMGIYTTDNFQDLFAIENLDSIIELTNSRDVLQELIRQRPRRLGVVEHNIGRFLRSFFLAEEKLKTAEHQVQLEKMSSDFLIQQSDAAIALLNTDFTIDDVNEAYLRLVGKSKTEALGNYCYQVHYGLNAPCASARPTMACPMLETLKTGKSSHVIREFPGMGDQPVYSNIVTYPLVDRSGEIIKIIEIWRDITQELTSKWEVRVQALKTDLNRMVQEDRMISLGKLVASCAHEINNPIQGLLIYSDLMLEILAKQKSIPADLMDFKRYLAMMSRELERCGTIVSGLLAFSRETPLEFTRVNIHEVLDAVIMLTRHRMGLQEIELKTDFVDANISVRGDANRLQQALLNLVFNAMEAMPAGGSLSVATGLEAGGKTVRIEIEDTGTGIPKDRLHHIFDPFFTTKAEGEGTGLGLSIVYGIIRNHGGRVRVRSEVGQGTAFVLELPTVSCRPE